MKYYVPWSTNTEFWCRSRNWLRIDKWGEFCSWIGSVEKLVCEVTAAIMLKYLQFRAEVLWQTYNWNFFIQIGIVRKRQWWCEISINHSFLMSRQNNRKIFLCNIILTLYNTNFLECSKTAHNSSLGIYDNCNTDLRKVKEKNHELYFLSL